MSQIFAGLLNLMWESSLSIASVGKSGRLGLAPREFFLRQYPLECQEMPICSILCTCFIIDLHAEKEKLILQTGFIEI